MNWYIDNNGSRWRLCKIVSTLLGWATVRLYDHITNDFTGPELRGRPKQGVYGVLVVEVKQ